MGTGVWCGHEQDITDFRRHQTYCLRTRFPPFLSDSEKTLLPTPWPTLAAAGAATLAHARAAVDAVVRSQESGVRSQVRGEVLAEIEECFQPPFRRRMCLLSSPRVVDPGLEAVIPLGWVGICGITERVVTVAKSRVELRWAPRPLILTSRVLSIEC